MMNLMRMNYMKWIGICAMLAGFLAHIPEKPVAAAGATSVDLSSELRTLDTFVADLGKLDKKRVELGKKDSLTRAEFNALQNSSDELKRRLATINGALQEIT